MSDKPQKYKIRVYRDVEIEATDLGVAIQAALSELEIYDDPKWNAVEISEGI